MIELLFFIVWSVLVAGLAFEAGEASGAQSHYKGDITCETLKNSSIHCYPTVSVKPSSTTK